MLSKHVNFAVIIWNSAKKPLHSARNSNLPLITVNVNLSKILVLNIKYPFKFLSGFVLKKEGNVCGHRAFATQVEDLFVLFGEGMRSLKQIADRHVDPLKELFSAIGHSFVISQVKLLLHYLTQIGRFLAT